MANNIPILPPRSGETVDVRTEEQNKVHTPYYKMAAGETSTAFGEMSVAELTPIIQLQFPYSVNPRLITSTTEGSGAATVSGSLLTCSTGATTASDVHLSSAREAKYHPGQGSLTRFTAIYQADGTAGTTAVAGYGNVEDGFFFGYNGAAFSVLHRSDGNKEFRTLTFTTGAVTTSGTITITLDGTATGVEVVQNDSVQAVARAVGAVSFVGWETQVIGDDVVFISHHAHVEAGSFSFVDTDTTGVASTAGLVQTITGKAATQDWIAQTAWNKDVMDGSGPSGMTLDVAKGNVYQIRFQWLGFGDIRYYVENPATGEFVLIHEIGYANNNVIPVMQNPTLPLHIGVVNGATTTDIVIKSASMASFTEGKIDTSAGLNNSAVGTRASYDFTTQTSLLAVKSKPIFQAVENRVEWVPKILSFTGRGAGAAKFHTLRVWINPILGGDPVFTDVSTATSIMSFDTAGTTVSGGNNIATFKFGKTIEAFVLDITTFGVAQPPGTMVVFTVELDGGTSDVDIGFIWREDF